MPKISALPIATQANDADLLVIDQQNVTKSLLYSLLTYNSGGTSRLLSSKLGDLVSVKDPPFLAKGDGVTDDTAAIQAAINFTKTFLATQTEVGLLWPAGAYKVTSLDFTGANRIDNIAIGSVIIYGTSVGGTAILHADGASGVTPATHLNFRGNFSVQIFGGGSYQYGVRWNTLTRSYQHMDVSGNYSVAAFDIAFSFDNEFWVTPTNSNPAGAPAFNCSDGNTNNNKLYLRGQCVAGLGTVLMLRGGANKVTGDFNTALNGIDLGDSFGTLINAPYFEGTKNCIVANNSAASKGIVVVGGEFEVGTNGAAFAGSGGGGGGTQNVKFIGARMKGVAGGNTRTAFSLGTLCFEFSEEQTDTSVGGIDTFISGTWQGGAGGLSSWDALVAQWIGFQPIQVASSDPNTLDDYAEKSWTPVLTNVTPGDLAITYAVQQGYATKKGREVTVNFFIQTSAFTHTTSAGVYRITGLPYIAANIANNSSCAAIIFSGVTKANYTTVYATIDANTQLIYLSASGSGQPWGNVVAADLPSGGTIILIGSLTYVAPT